MFVDQLRPDAPIERPEDDRLDRLPFVQRVANAVIHPNGAASGSVIGITGDWGSGKSSVLNLLAVHLKEKFRTAIIVRFNPWLVSARDEVIASFFSTFLEAIRQQSPRNAVYGSRQDQIVENVVEIVASYGGELTPLLNLAIPGLEVIGRIFAKGAERRIKERKGLEFQKRQMANALSELGRPIVVLIDELDRVEDSEIRVMAQVVRSIADFPEISYVLAYDEKRVADALGDGNVARGRSYLEKIVNLQIPLPVLLPDELRTLLTHDLALTLDERARESVVTNPRFSELIERLIPDVVQTGRDIARLVSSVRTRYPMIEGDVDWVDLVTFTAIELKAPELIAAIRTRYEYLVFDGHSVAPQKEIEAEFESAAPILKAQKQIRALFESLFPEVSGEHDRGGYLPDQIAFRRPLLTLLRLSIIPGAISRTTAIAIISKGRGDMASALRAYLDKREIEGVTSRIRDLGFEYDLPDDYWLALVDLIEMSGGADYAKGFYCREMLKDTAQAFEQIYRNRRAFDRAARILEKIIGTGFIYFPSIILRDQFFAFGLHGARKDGPERAVLKAEEIEPLAKALAAQIERRLETPGRFRSLIDPSPIYFMRDIGHWVGKLKDNLATELNVDYRTVDRLIYWISAGQYGFDTGTLDDLADAATITRLVADRTDHPGPGASLDPFLVPAFDKFKRVLRRH